MNIVDRRPNPKGKSLSNRQRFLARARVEVKSAVQEALRKRKVADVGHGDAVGHALLEISEHVIVRIGRNDEDELRTRVLAKFDHEAPFLVGAQDPDACLRERVHGCGEPAPARQSMRVMRPTNQPIASATATAV